jgi:hypothetical protein
MKDIMHKFVRSSLLCTACRWSNSRRRVTEIRGYLSEVAQTSGSAIGIATRYGMDGPSSNPGGGKIYRFRRDRLWGPPSLVYNGYRVFPGGKAAEAWR